MLQPLRHSPTPQLGLNQHLLYPGDRLIERSLLTANCIFIRLWWRAIKVRHPVVRSEHGASVLDSGRPLLIITTYTCPQTWAHTGPGNHRQRYCCVAGNFLGTLVAGTLTCRLHISHNLTRPQVLKSTVQQDRRFHSKRPSPAAGHLGRPHCITMHQHYNISSIHSVFEFAHSDWEGANFFKSRTMTVAFFITQSKVKTPKWP